MNFSTNLRNLRVSRQMTQMALARELGTSQSAIAAWENGSREPDFRTISRLAEFFHVPMSALLPSNEVIDESYARSVAESLNKNPRLSEIFEKIKTMPDNKLDAILVMVNVLSVDNND